jgi:23S rRNA (uridine2552-2'-O)-methyltransferase
VAKRKQDHLARKAHAQGFPARSVYKLEEIDRRTQLLRPGQRVLDLGCAPGSWVKYIAGRVGPTGLVLGFDLQPVSIALPPHARCAVLDVLANDPPLVVDGRGFDVVVSDMAPSTEGVRFADQYRSYELYRRALDIAARALVPGGSFVGKIFQGAELDEAKKATSALFEKTRIIRPEGTRTESYELFLVGAGKKLGD